jgi:hypothetical protein
MKRFWSVIAMTFLFLLVAYVAANVRSGRVLENELSAVRERGEPLSLKEAAPPLIPDAENAAVVYGRAFKLLPKLSGEEQTTLIQFGRSGSDRDKDVSPDKIRPILAKSQDALAVAEEASKMPRCRFPVNYEAGAGALFPHLSHLREITRLWAARARLNAMEGRPAEAISDVEAILSVARQLNDEPVLVTKLVQYSSIALADRGLKSVLESSSPTAQELQPLYDEVAKIDLYSAFVHALEGERALGLWVFDTLQKNPAQLSALDGGDEGVFLSKLTQMPGYRVVSEPYLRKDELFYLKRMDKQIELAKAHRRPEREGPVSNTSDGSIFKDEHIRFPWYALISKLMLPSFVVASEKRDQAVATLSLMQGAMALSVYKQQTGQYPSNVTEVVTKTGWSLNKDPFTDRDLTYHREGKGYLLYSLGPNGRDDGGWSSYDHFANEYPGRRRRSGQNEDDAAFWMKN